MFNNAQHLRHLFSQWGFGDLGKPFWREIIGRKAFERGFSKAESGKIIEKVLMEEGRPPESIFDFVQGITRLARDKTQQDARLDMEGRAKKLLDRVG